jgi:uncharacterized protein YbbC (DUF1343 family)
MKKYNNCAFLSFSNFLKNQKMKINNLLILIFLKIIFSLEAISQDNVLYKIVTRNDVQTGADRTNLYLGLLKGKRVALVANQTSIIGNTHLVDSLLKLNVNIVKIFCPEHGFRGEAEAGVTVNASIDEKTGLQIISLYGKNKKPTNADLKNVDIIVFDIQDVGVRFYTYISTLHYVMEACAENNIPLVILDRPNPLGYFVDGPVLDPAFSSFVGMHPVPIVHGMTIAEYAQMINGEKWLKNNVSCKLHIITVDNYNHTYYYILPVKPSPNLVNMNAVYLYPSLCLFEGTDISIGRGTSKPFQVIGHPKLEGAEYSFTPQSIKGMSENPPHLNQVCYGYDLSEYSVLFQRFEKQINIYWLLDLYKRLSSKTNFFNYFFDKLAGGDSLRKQIIAGKNETEIRESWKNDLSKFKKIRKKYLLYIDFED